MPRRFHRHLSAFLLILLAHLPIRAQDVVSSETINLRTYVLQLEQDFDVKFSFVDEDLSSLTVEISEFTSLPLILEDIREQTQLLINKLNERYYTLSKSSTVDICARVLDNFERSTISGATVEVLGSSIATIANLDGEFRLTNIPRKAVIRIRHIGFRTQFVTAEDFVTASPCREIVLGVNYQQLEEVVVYELLTSGLTKQLDASITMNPGEFGILPGQIEPDVLQTIQALPGIKSIDETVSNINIRGGTNDQNLILWDNIKMYQSGHFFGLISAFNPYLTEEVTLIKNGTSAQYGDGVSGIIKMDTNDEIKDTSYGGGGFNLISGDIYGHVPFRGDMAMQFSARRSMTDFLNTPTYEQFAGRAFQDIQVTNTITSTDRDFNQEQNFYFYDFSGKFLYDYNEDHKVRLSFIYINNAFDYKETDLRISTTNRNTLDQENISFGGTLNSRWSDRFRSSLQGYYTRYNLDAFTSTVADRQQLTQKNNVDERSVRLNTYFDLSPTLSWLNGYQLNETGITNGTIVTEPFFNNESKSVIRGHSGYTELTYTSDDRRMHLSGGLRVNYLQNLDTFDEVLFEPRLNFHAFLANNFRMEILGEFKNQVTNQFIDLDENFLGIEKRRWVLSDGQSIPITKSKQGSIGFNYEKENWYVGLEGFYKEVDGISTSTQGFQNQNQFNGEIGKYDNKGVEFLINHRNANFSSWLSYTFNDNNYTFEDIIPPNFPNNRDIKHSFTLATTYAYRNLKVGLGFNYRTGKPFTEPLDPPNDIDTSDFPFRIIYNEPNSSRLPQYIRLDASAVYDFPLSRRVNASIGASALNVLDRENILNTYFRLDEQFNIETVKSLSLGFTPNVSFRVRF
ncbi:MAG: TonB-dependent receptor [Flavobacteriaceae bacterium]|nr:TonB-dependent receptor [Flavobacteriaceae bacterium]